MVFIHKFGTFYTLACRHFQICSKWTKLNTELLFPKKNFLQIDYPKNFINKCFKRLMDSIYAVKETTQQFRNTYCLSPFKPGSISLQTTTKLKKSLKNILICCKLLFTVFKERSHYLTTFFLKIAFPKILLLVSFSRLSVNCYDST